MNGVYYGPHITISSEILRSRQQKPDRVAGEPKTVAKKRSPIVSDILLAVGKIKIVNFVVVYLKKIKHFIIIGKFLILHPAASLPRLVQDFSSPTLPGKT